MKYIIITILLLSITVFTSCNPEGVETEKLSDQNSEGTDSTGEKSNVDTSFNNEIIDSANFIKEVEEVVVDTSGGKEKMLDSGVKMKWLINGKGDVLKKGDVIWVNYKGFLPNGMMFDGDKAATQEVPLKLGLNMVVPGLESALINMRVGDYVKVLVPSEEGYGEKEFKTVPGNSDLLYEVIVRKKQSPQIMDNGIKIWKLKSSDKALFKDGDEVKFHYFGHLKSGKQYDNSYKKHQPFTFILGSKNIMQGLNHIFRELKKGEKAFVEIPSNLAYGKKGLKDLVPANTDIIYYLDVLE